MNDDQLVTSLQTELKELKNELSKLNDKKSESTFWKLTAIILPIILTSVFTYFLKSAESDITLEVNRQNEILSSSLSVTEKLYEKRLETYPQLYSELLGLESSIAQFQIENNLSQVFEMTSTIYKKTEEKRLIMSDTLYNTLAEVIHSPWELRTGEKTDVIVSKTLELINQVIKLMKSELFIEDLTRFEKLRQAT